MTAAIGEETETTTAEEVPEGGTTTPTIGATMIAATMETVVVDLDAIAHVPVHALPPLVTTKVLAEHQHQHRKPAPPKKKLPDYHVANQEPDAKLGDLQDDPRGSDPTKRITKKASHRGNGRNTESFDPASTLVRPDLRIHVGSSRSKVFNRPLKHDDVVIVPELFGEEEDWTLYYQLVEEMREIHSDPLDWPWDPSGSRGTRAPT